ncbi:MAG: lysophospholipid acyltransferase family protein [Candidatus Nanopelagicales bacterium]
MAEAVYTPVITSAKVMFAALGLRFDRVGTDLVPARGGAVLASNHVSYYDFIFCGYAAHPSKRLVRFMAKDSVFRHRISGPLMRGMKHIPVDRSAGADAYRLAVDALRAGEIVGVFPEATISRSFELKDFKSGAARMAAEAGVPLIPMITFGGQRMWTKGHQRRHGRGTCIALTVGEPMSVAPDDDPTEVTALLHRRMSVLLDQTLERYPQKPTEPGAWWWPQRLGGGAPTLEEAAAMDAEEAAERQRAREQRDPGAAPA